MRIASKFPLKLVSSDFVSGSNFLTSDSDIDYNNRWGVDNQNSYHDIYGLHSFYISNAPEVTHEYNLLNDILCKS